MIKEAIHVLFSTKRFRLVQRLTRVRRVHHPRWSFGFALPYKHWVYFEPYTYKDQWAGYAVTKPGHWQQCTPTSYHDSTTTGRY